MVPPRSNPVAHRKHQKLPKPCFLNFSLLTQKTERSVYFNNIYLHFFVAMSNGKIKFVSNSNDTKSNPAPSNSTHVKQVLLYMYVTIFSHCKKFIATA